MKKLDGKFRSFDTIIHQRNMTLLDRRMDGHRVTARLRYA